MNGEPAVIIAVQNTLEEDALDIAEKVRNYVSDFNEENDVVKATVVRDGSIILNQRIELLTENGLMGFGIVLVLLAFFLHWRMAFWVALAIPISFAGMFFIAYSMGATINVISLFGMILVIGILAFVYRAPLPVLVPLISIGIALSVSSSLIALPRAIL